MVASHSLSLTDDLYNIMRLPLAYDSAAKKTKQKKHTGSPVESNMKLIHESLLPMSCSQGFVTQSFIRVLGSGLCFRGTLCSPGLSLFLTMFFV